MIGYPDSDMHVHFAIFQIIFLFVLYRTYAYDALCYIFFYIYIYMLYTDTHHVTDSN